MSAADGGLENSILVASPAMIVGEASVVEWGWEWLLFVKERWAFVEAYRVVVAPQGNSFGLFSGLRFLFFRPDH